MPNQLLKVPSGPELLRTAVEAVNVVLQKRKAHLEDRGGVQAERGDESGKFFFYNYTGDRTVTKSLAELLRQADYECEENNTDLAFTSPSK